MLPTCIQNEKTQEKILWLCIILHQMENMVSIWHANHGHNIQKYNKTVSCWSLERFSIETLLYLCVGRQIEEHLTEHVYITMRLSSSQINSQPQLQLHRKQVLLLLCQRATGIGISHKLSCMQGISIFLFINRCLVIWLLHDLVGVIIQSRGEIESNGRRYEWEYRWWYNIV